MPTGSARFLGTAHEIPCLGDIHMLKSGYLAVHDRARISLSHWSPLCKNSDNGAKRVIIECYDVMLQLIE